jgi:hypothetical protein
MSDNTDDEAQFNAEGSSAKRRRVDEGGGSDYDDEAGDGAVDLTAAPGS